MSLGEDHHMSQVTKPLNADGKGGGGKGGGGKGGGSNWPSKTGNPSGGGRTSNPPKK